MKIKNSKLLELKAKIFNNKNKINDNFWDISNGDNNIQEIINKTNSKILYTIIEKLNPIEAEVLYTLFKNNGYSTQNEILSKLNIEISELSLITKSLESKHIIFIRKNISNLQLKIHSYGIYKEIYQNLKTAKWLEKDEIINNHKKLKNYKITNPNLSKKLNNILTLNLGQCHIKIEKDQELKEEIHKLLNKNILESNLIFSKKFYTSLKLKENYKKYLSKNENSEDIIFPKKLLLLKSIHQISHKTQTDKLTITKKNVLKQSDQNLLLSQIKDEKIIEISLKFLINSKLISIENNTLKSSKKLLNLIKLNYLNQYKEILKLKEKSNQILKYIKKYFPNNHFNLKEIIKCHVKELITKNYQLYHPKKNQNLNESQILEEISFLTYSGIINSEKKGLIISSLGKEILENKEEINSIVKKSTTITSDLSLIAYTDNITNQTLHQILIFSELKSNYNNVQALVFKITKDSISSGVVMGNNHKDFINCLEKSSSSKIPNNILYNINSWGNLVQEVKIKTVKLLTGEKKIIEKLKHHILLKNNLQECNNNIIFEKKSKIPKYIKSENEIIIIKEDE